MRISWTWLNSCLPAKDDWFWHWKLSSRSTKLSSSYFVVFILAPLGTRQCNIPNSGATTNILPQLGQEKAGHGAAISVKAWHPVTQFPSKIISSSSTTHHSKTTPTHSLTLFNSYVSFSTIFIHTSILRLVSFAIRATFENIINSIFPLQLFILTLHIVSKLLDGRSPNFIGDLMTNF